MREGGRGGPRGRETGFGELLNFRIGGERGRWSREESGLEDLTRSYLAAEKDVGVLCEASRRGTEEKLSPRSPADTKLSRMIHLDKQIPQEGPASLPMDHERSIAASSSMPSLDHIDERAEVLGQAPFPGVRA